MTQENTVVADENSEHAASGEVDAQLEQMRQTETQETPVEEVKHEPEVKTKEERVVPLAALHEERNARKALQAELAQQRQMMERVNQRLEVLMQPRAQAPDPSNAVEYLDHQIKQVAQPVQQLLERDARRQQDEEQQRAVQAAASQVVRSEAEFAKQTPDYQQAVDYLKGARARELTAFGMTHDQAAAQAGAELAQAAISWAAQGQDPAHIAYEFAQARGYQKTAAQPSAAERIAAQQKGTQAARSLGAGGAATGGKLTAQALADMSDEDFAKLSETDWRKAMGG